VAAEIISPSSQLMKLPFPRDQFSHHTSSKPNTRTIAVPWRSTLIVKLNSVKLAKNSTVFLELSETRNPHGGTTAVVRAFTDLSDSSSFDKGRPQYPHFWQVQVWPLSTACLMSTRVGFTLNRTAFKPVKILPVNLPVNRNSSNSLTQGAS
jgi:hypothetical protein